MAKNCSLALYKVSITEARKSDSARDLSQRLNGKYANFFEYLESFLVKHKKDLFSDKEDNHFLRVKKVEQGKEGSREILEGLIETGDSGYSTALHHQKTRLERKREKEEVEFFPLYFLASETTDAKSVALCLQRFGHVGAKTTLAKALKKDFKAEFPSLVLNIEDFLPDFYIKKFIENNQVHEFKYTCLAPVSDIASLLIADGNQETRNQDAVVTIKVKPKRGQLFRLGMSGGEKESSSIGERLSNVKPRGSFVDESKILDKSITFVNDDGKKRTFILSKPDNNALPYIDITREAGTGSDGHPEYAKLQVIARDILKESKLI